MCVCVCVRSMTQREREREGGRELETEFNVKETILLTYKQVTRSSFKYQLN